MEFLLNKRSSCCVCQLDTVRRTGWFLVVENRWLDRLKILSWHGSLATQKDMKSVCGREHLKTLIAHWLDQASLQTASALDRPMAIGSDSEAVDVDLGPSSVGRLLGELAVHRESFSRVWTGSPAALEGILDALLTIEVASKPNTLEFRIFAPRKPAHELSLQ
jgi:hypothetical protein